MQPLVHSAVLLRAAEILGGKSALRVLLRVSVRELDTWLEGSERPPVFVFLQAVDVISAHAGSRSVQRLQQEARQREHALAEALDAALDETEAERGNIQLAHPEGLRIAAQVGFEQPFLDFFAVVTRDTPSSCGPAHAQAQRVVVPDVLSHPLFAGTQAARVMERAGALAVQSTPLFGRGGAVVGMLSTHYEKPHEPSAAELAALDRIARHAGELLS